MQPRLFSLPILAAAILTAPAFPAGVTLLNQATVQAAGGFPYVISQSGSYQLSSDLVVPCGTADGIDITAPHVTLDLGGFTISCAVANAFNGVSVVSVTGVTIQNGAITGFGGARRGANAPVSGSGIAASNNVAMNTNVKISNMTVTQNGNGITGDGWTVFLVTNSTVDSNSGNGINAPNGAQISSSDVSFNGGSGIIVGFGLVTGCQVDFNTTNGINVTNFATVTNNTIGLNGNTNPQGFGLGSTEPLAVGPVGYGSNTFISNGPNTTTDVVGTITFVSMKNNVSAVGVLF